jgi:beta-lactamase class A
MSLKDQIQTVIAESGIDAGIALHHIESGEEVMIDADSYYPMASVFKIPILVEGCFQLAEGQIRPDDRWTLYDEDKNFPSGVLVFFKEGLTPTVQDLLTLMIIISDNSATDILMNRLGKRAINGRMKALGLEHIHLPMTVRELFAEVMPDTNPNKPIQELYKQFAERDESEPRFDTDSRIYKRTPENNVATPREMTELLRKIYAGETPDREWSDFALNILLRQQLNARIPRLLPQGTLVAHKTGTIGPVRNDAGIIYISDDSHVVLSEFVLWDIPLEDPLATLKRTFEVETAMGEISLLAYEAFK